MRDQPALSASVVLAAYAELVVAAGRVLVVGEATTPLVERLLERGARLVHVVDPDATRVAEAATHNADRHVSFAPLGPGGLPVRDGAFDVAIVENLAALGEPATVLRQVRRALGARGTAIIASPNPDAPARLLPRAEAGTALDYYALYDLVVEVFGDVKMLGQSPFVGYSIAEFAPEAEPEPVLDAEFVPGGVEEPEWYLAVAAREGAGLEPLNVIQLPARDVLAAATSSPLEAQLRTARAAERHARERLADVETELARRGAEGNAAEAAAQVERLESELRRRDAWARQLEERAATADERADAVQAELDTAESRVTEVSRELAEVRAELAELRRGGAKTEERARELAEVRAELAEVRAELAEVRRGGVKTEERAREFAAERDRLRSTLVAERARATDAEARAQSAQSAREADATRLAELNGFEQQAAAELAVLERQLVEQGNELRDLERRRREAARAGAELVVEVERLRAGGELAELRSAAAALELRNAELTAELQAARWASEARASELGNVEITPVEADLRARLAEAEARLNEQAVLIEQLRGQAAVPADGGEPSPA
jgi:SAM-dependent methyltransferase